MKKKLVIATYNLQFSLHPEEIKRSVRLMVRKGVGLFCFQEVVHLRDKQFIINDIQASLGKDWDVLCFLGKEDSILGMGNCVVWNTNVLHFVKEQKINLPKCSSLSLPEKVFSWLAGGILVPFQRRAVIGYFTFNNKQFRITNIHLDHNGGISNRRKQLSYLMDYLGKQNGVHEVLCGDFNSFDLLNNGKEGLMHQEILGHEFVDISKNVDWTADLNDIDIHYGKRILTFFIKALNLHIKKKLDYVWVRNIETTSCEKLVVKGSDHLPLIACLNI